MYVLYVLGKDKGPQKTIYKGQETNMIENPTTDAYDVCIGRLYFQGFKLSD